MQANKGYTRSNVRVVLLGVNGLRGSGTNEDTMRIASGVVKYGPKEIQERNRHEAANKAWETRKKGST